MNLAHKPEGITLEQAVMVPDMMCTAFEGVQALDMKFGESVAVLGIGPVGLMAVRAAVLQGAGRIFAIGSRQICFDVAAEYGATDLIDYHQPDYIETIIKNNQGPVDRVVLCGGGRLMLSRMAELIACGRVQPEKLITHRYHGMKQIPEAMNLFLNHDRSLIKPVIYNDKEQK